MTTELLLWIVAGIVLLSLLVSIASGIVYITHITKAKREQKKRDREARLEQEKRDAELFKLFKEEMKKKGLK